MLDYDFTLSATLIQAVYRGHEVRQRLKLALKRASGCFEEILQEMQAVCPDYHFCDGVDVLAKNYSEGVVYIPLLTPCDAITLSSSSPLEDLNHPPLAPPVAPAAVTSQASTSPSTIAITTTSPAPLTAIASSNGGDGVVGSTSTGDLLQRREKLLLEEKQWLEDAIVRRLRVSTHCLLPLCLTMPGRSQLQWCEGMNGEWLLVITPPVKGFIVKAIHKRVDKEVATQRR
eukprot:scaffold1949_cov176-Ochromonas_danica.AAC.5